MTSEVKLFCPVCGGQSIADAGSVFIEDGPYNGKRYANEGDFPRYECRLCHACFGPMPEPIACKNCGDSIMGGEVGEDCEVVNEDAGEYLCFDCMKLTDEPDVTMEGD